MNETPSVASITKMLETLVEQGSIFAGHNTKVIDIVKDAINPVSIYWAANFVVCLVTSGLDVLFMFGSAWFAHCYIRQCFGGTHSSALVCAICRCNKVEVKLVRTTIADGIQICVP